MNINDAKKLRQSIFDEISREVHSVESELERVSRDIDVATAERREAAEKGDLRENVAYQTATEKISQLEGERHRLLQKVDAWKEFVAEFNEHEIGVKQVELSSLVVIKVDGQELPLMVTPSALASFKTPTLSTGSGLGKRIVGKLEGQQVGDYTLLKVY